MYQSAGKLPRKYMKRALAFALCMALCMALCIGCGRDDEQETQQPSAGPEATATATNDGTQAMPSVLLQQDGVVIAYTGTKFENGADMVLLRIGNATDVNIAVRLQATTVEGVVIDPSFSVQVAPGQTSDETVTFMEEALHAAGISAFQNVAGSFVVSNADTGEELFQSAIMPLITQPAETEEPTPVPPVVPTGADIDACVQTAMNWTIADWNASTTVARNMVTAYMQSACTPRAASDMCTAIQSYFDGGGKTLGGLLSESAGWLDPSPFVNVTEWTLTDWQNATSEQQTEVALIGLAIELVGEGGESLSELRESVGATLANGDSGDTIGSILNGLVASINPSAAPDAAAGEQGAAENAPAV